MAENQKNVTSMIIRNGVIKIIRINRRVKVGDMLAITRMVVFPLKTKHYGVD